MEIIELWQGGAKMIRSSAAFPVTMDSVVLSSFAHIGRAKRLLDLGSGSGIISLLILNANPSITATLAELSPGAAEISRRNLELNGFLSRSSVICTDLCLLRQRDVGLFDIVVTNPPYFKTTGTASPSPAHSAARLEEHCDLCDVVTCASSLLHTGGKFDMVYPVSRLSEALCILTANSLEPKRLRLVAARPEAAPSVFLVECIKCGKAGLSVEPMLLLQNDRGGDSDEIKRMYHFTRED